MGRQNALPRSVVSPALQADVPAQVRQNVVPVLAQGRSPVLVELDLTRDVRTEDTRERFLALYAHTIIQDDHPDPLPIADNYVSCVLSPEEIELLLTADHGGEKGRAPTIFRVWPDYTMHAHIDRSVSTIKSDAADRSYAATGEGVTWAVLDSGIDGAHPHFASGTLGVEVDRLHRDFTHLVPPASPEQADPKSPLIDPDGHGTHVAGIIAGALPDGTEPVIGCQQTTLSGLPQWTQRRLKTGRRLAGMAPQAKLVSLKTLAPRNPDGLVTSSSAVIEALYYVRKTVNSGGRLLLIHGVNMSFGCPWDPRDYACGQSPLCREAGLLAATGVVVVVSAGNGGYAGQLDPMEGSSGARAVLATITDPGNADGAITVGSTHRDSPHVFGVTYSSSKGPTLDGRLKPDLLAPGERITSCAAGSFSDAVAELIPAGGDNHAAYIEESGTSMAAPHVSGAIAAFLSAHPEYIGMPRQVKELFCANATSLGRDRYLEGHGLIDVMRVLSNV